MLLSQTLLEQILDILLRGANKLLASSQQWQTRRARPRPRRLVPVAAARPESSERACPGAEQAAGICSLELRLGRLLRLQPSTREVQDLEPT